MVNCITEIVIQEFINEFNAENDSSDDEMFLDLMRIEFRRQVRRKRPRVEGYSENLIPLLSDAGFKSHFRMTRTTCQALLDILGPKLASARTRHDLRVGRRLTEPMKQLMVTLWTLATPDSYRSICERFGIGKATGLRIVRRVIKALISIRSVVIKWPSDEEAAQSAIYFKQKFSFPGVIGAIDRTHVKIDAPHESPEAYINRKGYDSIHLQVVCQENLKFIHCFAGFPGSVHDSRVFKRSGMQAICSTEARFPNDTHLLGDAAYTNQTHLLVPYKNNGHLSEREVNYNTRLSSTRMVVERSIGLLKNRFRILLDRVPVRRTDLIPSYIIACCVLHNFCLTNADYMEIPLVIPNYIEDLNANVEVNVNLRNEGRMKRDLIKNALP